MSELPDPLRPAQNAEPPATLSFLQSDAMVHPFDLMPGDLDPAQFEFFSIDAPEGMSLQPTGLATDCGNTLSTILCDCVNTLSTLFCLSCEGCSG